MPNQPGPDQILSVLPSRAALAETIAAEAVSEPGVVAAEGLRGVGKTAMANLVAVQLRGRGRLVVPMTGPFSRLPSETITPAWVTRALLLASGTAIGSEDIAPERLLRSLLGQPGLQDLVLIIDDADALPPATWRFLDLLVGLSQLSKARLRLVLFGAPGRWPDLRKLPRLHVGLSSVWVIDPLTREEAAGYAMAVAEQTGRTLDRKRLERILDTSDGSLAQLDAAVRDMPSALSRTRLRPGKRWMWPALAVGGPALAGTVALAAFAGWQHSGPVGAPYAETAPAEVTPAEVTQQTVPASAIGATAPQLVARLSGAAVSGKAVAGAAAVSVVLARVEGAPSLAANVAPLALPMHQDPAPTGGTAHEGTGVAQRTPAPPAGPDIMPVRGLLLVARPGDTLAALYAEVYRGHAAPPFADISAANPAPVRPGAVVVFPAPSGGWAKPDARR